jgi:hypothetical protein
VLAGPAPRAGHTSGANVPHARIYGAASVLGAAFFIGKMHCRIAVGCTRENSAKKLTHRKRILFPIIEAGRVPSDKKECGSRSYSLFYGQ